jgi:protein TonB
VLREVKPQYTLEAMRAKIQGTVLLDCVVKADGTVGDVEVLRSLDKTGLDQEAIRAARAWQFEPGTRNGEPVPVLVTIELTFTLRPSEPMRFELRLAEYQAGAGLREASLAGSGERVYLYDSALATSADIVEASVGQDGTRFSLLLTLTPAAGQKVLTATSDHTGRPVAILVNERVMSAPLLSTPMGEFIRITGTFTKEEAEAIVRELNSAHPKF